jgi:geranylgeranyl pyrophosphate synthase
MKLDFLTQEDTRELRSFLDELEGEFDRFVRSHKGFLSQLTDYVLRNSGKRVRPALVYLSSQMGSSVDLRTVKEVAVAVEMIHIATLIHDDLVDEAGLRRQKPTVRVKFGDGAAVLLGDYVYAQAFQRLAALGTPTLLNLFSQTTSVMCEGEIGQWEGRYKFDLSQGDYLSFLQKKTASLIAASCRAGGMLAGLSEDHKNALDDFGQALGIAFQIVDDILDVEGDEEVTGKTLRTDLTHGKMTLPLIIHADRLSSPEEREALFHVLKNPNGQIAELIGHVQKSGVMDLCRGKVQSLLTEATHALSRLPDHPSRHLLAHVAEHLSHRKQ